MSETQLQTGQTTSFLGPFNYALEYMIDATQRVPSLSLADFKALVREQYLMLLIDPDAGIEAIPSMLPPDPSIRSKGLDVITEVLSARGELSSEENQRSDHIVGLFGVKGSSSTAPRRLRVREPNASVQPKAS
jgi:hypothetical protein